MNSSRLEGKVGLFVFIGLALLVALVLQFSKGTSLFRPTYDILLRAGSVGGLKTRAQVLMAGVQVGAVSDIRLAREGKSVLITLTIYRDYQIHKDARFVIEQSGFLGDQYVAILPTENKGDCFGPGDEAKSEAPLDIQEVARSAAGFLTHIDSAATNVNNALNEARATIFSLRALTNLAATFDNFHLVSERSLSIADNVGALVESNRPSINVSVSNLVFFSEEISRSAAAVRELLATNSPEIEVAVHNIESSSVTLKNLLEGVQAGKGLAGKMLENEEIAANVSQIISNLNITTSNLNRLGVWGVLWGHKLPHTNAPASPRRPLTAPKNTLD